MDNEIKNAVRATDQNAQYDAGAKRLLGQKIILAHILVKAVDEFRGMNPKEIVPLIEGTPYIGTVPLEPGLTNQILKQGGQKVAGSNTEYAELKEGLVRFDIVFYVRMKDGVSQMIVNVEAQKDEPTRYEILNRAVFYVSRLISSQKERDFENTNYDDIKRVFSIWVCMNMSENSMTYVHLTKENLLGDFEWKGRLDLLNIVLLGLTEEPPKQKEAYELHRLIGALLSNSLSVKEKLDIIETEYGIPIEDSIRKDVSLMCNLSEKIEEKGMEKGIAIGMEKGMEKAIFSMYKNGLSPERIASIMDKGLEEVEAIITGEETLLVHS